MPSSRYQPLTEKGKVSVFSGFVCATARKARGFTQEIAAERSGLTISAYNRIEKCRTIPMFHTACNIAKALKIPVGKLHREVALNKIGADGLPIDLV